MKNRSFLLALCLGLPAVLPAATLEIYLPLDGDTNAGPTTSVAGTVVGTNPNAADNFTTGKFGQAGKFQNTNGNSTTMDDWAVSVGNQDPLYASSFTVSFWVRTNTAGYVADKALVGNKDWNSGGNIGWTFSTFSVGGAGRINWNSAGAGAARKDPALAFNTGAWCHVVAVFDRSTNTVERFLNGTSVGVTASAFGDAGAGNLGAGFNTLIGGSGNGTYGANAELDDVAIFRGTVTADQVTYLYNGGTGRTANQLAGFGGARDLVWTGALDGQWTSSALAAPKNWVLASDGVSTRDFGTTDTLTFDDSATATSITVEAAGVIPGAMTFTNETKNFTIGGGAIGGSAVLAKVGAGLLTLSGANTFTGPTIVDAGTLKIDHSLALQGSSVSTSFQGGSMLSFGTPTAATLGALGGDGDIALTNAGSQPVTLTLGSVDGSYGGELSGGGSIVKAGNGIQQLNLDNTFTGSVTVAGGVLHAGTPGALGSGAVTINDGAVDFGSTGDVTVPNNFVLPTAGTGVTRMFGVFSANRSAPSPGTTAVLSGKISGGIADRTFRFSDTGIGSEHDNVLVLTNEQNDFTGNIELWRATLAITSDAVLGNPENDFSHYSENLAGRLRFDADNITLNEARAITLPGAANSRPFDTQDFTATIAGPISGTAILVKQGTGKLILSSEMSSFSGPISVAAGTLQADGVIPASASVVTVAAGAKLGGAGIVQRPVTLSGMLSPGTGVGTLNNLGVVTFDAGSGIDFQISDWTGAAGSGYDTVTADSAVINATSATPGSIVLTPQSLVNFSNGVRSFTLLSTTGGITGFTPGAFTVDDSALPGATGIWSVKVSGNDLVLEHAFGTAYDTWATAKGLAGGDAAFGADPDKDGIANGIEFVIGGEPNPANPGSNSNSLLPTVATTATHLSFSFRRADDAAFLNPFVEYNVGLSGIWVKANGGENGILINEVNGPSGFDTVEVLIPRSLAAPGSKLFARLQVE